jgi:hypothetical protein
MLRYIEFHLQLGMALPVAIFVGESQNWIPELVEKARKLTVGPGKPHLEGGKGDREYV